MDVRRDRIALVERRLGEIEETMEILSDKRLVRSIERGLKDLREGRDTRYADVDTLFKAIEPPA